MKISAVYLIGNPEIIIHYTIWVVVEQALLYLRHTIVRWCSGTKVGRCSSYRKLREASNMHLLWCFCEAFLTVKKSGKYSLFFLLAIIFIIRSKANKYFHIEY